MLRALLDANVQISALVRPGGPPGVITRALLSQSAFELVISPAIAAEVERALSQKKIRKYLHNPGQALLWLSDLVAIADVVQDTGRVVGVCRDPDDDLVLGAAVEGRAAVIVTGDHDLLVLREYAGVAIVDPRGFLEFLTE